MKHYFKNTIFFLILGCALFSCAPVKYIPVETTKYVTVRDSVYLRDTVVKVELEKARLSDFVDLGDTLILQTDLARSTAFIQGNTGKLKGTLENIKPYVEKPVQIRERIVVRDSVITQEVPVPVEVEKRVRYVPFIYKLLSLFGAIALACLAWKYGKKYVLRWIA